MDSQPRPVAAFSCGASWHLYRAPSPARAMANFGGSLVQLLLLVVGVIADAALR
jgi:hypothetical protein